MVVQCLLSCRTLIKLQRLLKCPTLLASLILKHSATLPLSSPLKETDLTWQASPRLFWFIGIYPDDGLKRLWLPRGRLSVPTGRLRAEPSVVTRLSSSASKSRSRSSSGSSSTSSSSLFVRAGGSAPGAIPGPLSLYRGR